MGKKHTGPPMKRRKVGASRVDNPPTGSPSHISISEGDRSPPSSSRSCNSCSEPPPPRSTPRVSPRFPSRRPTPHPRKKGKPTKPKVPARSSDQPPKSPPATPSKSSNPFSLGIRRATLGDLEQIRAKYNIPPSVQLRIPHVNERPECPQSDLFGGSSWAAVPSRVEDTDGLTCVMVGGREVRHFCSGVEGPLPIQEA
ncbi:proline-rich receptor-like protein kinase PERK10 [Citrus clementina]|uniref:proline-rich receptor-like protein kinase PERK10 n=1 Tax=Citrus clementina TaxID=85681 RepID=UPI000CED0BE0|nr:proline-rich receptor-like protein kinase PERK10 [Citrus x clementina]